MGYKLRRQLRERLGPDISGLQRAVALEIADDANDSTRESWASLEDLARWTAAKDTGVVRNALKRLAASGWEFRVPLGMGKDGRILYAVPGKRLTFRVPPFIGVAPALPMAPSKGEPGLTPKVPQLPIGGAGAHSEGATATPFSSEVPSAISSSLFRAALRAVHDSGLVSEGDEREFIDWVNDKHKPRGAGWWQTIARNGDIKAHADQWRSESQERRASDEQQEVATARRVAIDDCAHCDSNGLTDEDHPRRCDHTPPVGAPLEMHA